MAKNAIVKEHSLGVSQHSIRLNWLWDVIVACLMCHPNTCKIQTFLSILWLCSSVKQTDDRNRKTKYQQQKAVFGHGLCVHCQWTICCENLHQMKHQVNSFQSANTTRLWSVIKTMQACGSFTFAHLNCRHNFKLFVHFHLGIGENRIWRINC